MIARRGAKYIVTIYDPVKRDKRWVGTFETRKEASKAEAQAKLEKRRRCDLEETCDGFADRWITSYPRRRESTNIGYAERVKKFAIDFKGVPLGDVSRLVARRWALANPGRYKTVRAMFSDAMRDGLVNENPFVNMRLPGSRGRRDLKVLTYDEVVSLAAHARELRGPVMEAFVLTAAFTGMRPGELYALQWPHVRLQDQEIDVVASYSSKSQQETPAKNDQDRIVVVPAPAIEALQAIRSESGYVFSTMTGKRLTGRTIHYQWDPVRKAAGQPEMHLHELRHFCAAYLLNVKGLPAHQVALQLGHTDGGVLVMRLYGHPSELLARDAIKAAFGSNVVPLKRVSGADSGAGA